ncbi:MAG TPA: NUDIX domain-containing protein [Ilumatobacteraceae bacterium]|nr:NUDIX domain-containing protein [Ilumatobacteraceae bacterium]HRB01992.1 NUDIX domain-containing protein [Ilumatobacteraceae bacterium]
MGSETELVDIVDDDDLVIATVTRKEMRAGRLQHRAVSIAVMGSDRRLLAHRRADDKDVWPGMWDMAAGGVVAAGESYEVAARRELSEELGIEVADFHHLGEGRFADESVALIGRGYLAVHDGPFTFTDGEIAEVRWVSAEELNVLMATEQFVPDNVELLLPLLLPFW